MPEGEIDVYTVREDDYRLTGVRIATQEEYNQRTKEMEALEAAAGRESSYVHLLLNELCTGNEANLSMTVSLASL